MQRVSILKLRIQIFQFIGLLALILAHLPAAWAQVGGPLFCDAQFYQIRVGTGGTRLLRYPTLTTTPVNVYTGNNQTTTIPSLSGINLNGLGFNNRDNYLYAIGLDSANGSIPLYRLGLLGGELVGNIPGVSNPFTSTAGVFDKQGRYYFAGQTTNNALVPPNVISPSVIYRVDNIPATGTGFLSIARSYAINITPLFNFGDFAFSDTADGINGTLYGTSNQGGLGTKHVRITLNDAAGTANVVVINATGADTAGTGSAIYDQPTDLFYMFSNGNNAFYRIDNFASGTPNAVQISAASNAPLTDNTGTSDGTSCIFASQQQADIRVLKSVNPTTTATVGQTVTFTVAVNNAGPSPAQNVTVADQLPSGLTFISASPTAGTYTAGSGNWVIANLPALSTQTLTLVATVNSFGTTTASFINVASVVGSNQVGTTTVILLVDPTPSNNTSTATVTAARSADLSISKTNAVNAPATLTAGQTTNYTITVSLGAGATASDVANARLLDPAASGLQCVLGAAPVCSASAGSVCPVLGAGVGQLSIANLQSGGVLIPLLKPGATMTFRVSCGVTATGI